MKARVKLWICRSPFFLWCPVCFPTCCSTAIRVVPELLKTQWTWMGVFPPERACPAYCHFRKEKSALPPKPFFPNGFPSWNRSAGWTLSGAAEPSCGLLLDHILLAALNLMGPWGWLWFQINHLGVAFWGLLLGHRSWGRKEGPCTHNPKDLRSVRLGGPYRW